MIRSSTGAPSETQLRSQPVVQKEPVRVELCAQRHEVVKARVGRAELRGGSLVPLAPMWPAGASEGKPLERSIEQLDDLGRAADGGGTEDDLREDSNVAACGRQRRGRVGGRVGGRCAVRSGRGNTLRRKRAGSRSVAGSGIWGLWALRSMGSGASAIWDLGALRSGGSALWALGFGTCGTVIRDAWNLSFFSSHRTSSTANSDRLPRTGCPRKGSSRVGRRAR